MFNVSIGGSNLSSLNSFQQLWFSKGEFDVSAALAPSATKFMIIGPPESEFSVWIGGSMQMWISKGELKFKVIAPPERKCSVWIGGFIPSFLSTFWLL